MPTTPDLGPTHILLYVEDNPASLNLVEQIIARYSDTRLLTAVNGNAGIEIARVSQSDVILMDINLPDISGFKALKILRSDPCVSFGRDPPNPRSASARSRAVVDDDRPAPVVSSLLGNATRESRDDSGAAAGGESDPSSLQKAFIEVQRKQRPTLAVLDRSGGEG